MAKRLLAKVGVKAKKNELVFYKDGNLYAVERKVGGTKGAKHKCSAAPAKKKKTATKKRSAAKKKTTVKKKAAPKKSRSYKMISKGTPVRVKLTKNTDGKTGFSTGVITSGGTSNSVQVRYSVAGKSVERMKTRAEIKLLSAPKKSATKKRRQLSLF